MIRIRLLEELCIQNSRTRAPKGQEFTVDRVILMKGATPFYYVKDLFGGEDIGVYAHECEVIEGNPHG